MPAVVALQHLRNEHRHHVGREGENGRSHTGHDDAGGRQAALPGHRVCERTARNLVDHAGHAADRERKPI
jgi:hypothetical protein